MIKPADISKINVGREIIAGILLNYCILKYTILKP